MSWTSQNAQELCDCIFSFSKARECEVSLELDDSGHTRFAALMKGGASFSRPRATRFEAAAGRSVRRKRGRR